MTRPRRKFLSASSFLPLLKGLRQRMRLIQCLLFFFACLARIVAMDSPRKSYLACSLLYVRMTIAVYMFIIMKFMMNTKRMRTRAATAGSALYIAS